MFKTTSPQGTHGSKIQNRADGRRRSDQRGPRAQRTWARCQEQRGTGTWRRSGGYESKTETKRSRRGLHGWRGARRADRSYSSCLQRTSRLSTPKTATESENATGTGVHRAVLAARAAGPRRAGPGSPGTREGMPPAGRPAPPRSACIVEDLQQGSF